MKRLITLCLLTGALLIPGSALQAQHAWADDPSGTTVDVSELQLPARAFAPAIIEQGGDFPADNTTAMNDFVHNSITSDDPHWQPMNWDVHYKSYGEMNRQGGWLQHSSFGRVYFDYLGSVFASSNDAQEAMRDGLEATNRENTPNSCYALFQVACYMTTFTVTALPELPKAVPCPTAVEAPPTPVPPPPATSAPAAPGQTAVIVQVNVQVAAPVATPACPTPVPPPPATSKVPPTVRVFYSVVRYNQCLVEAQEYTADSLTDAYPREMIQGTLATMVRAGYAQAQQACADPVRPAHKLDFSIVQVRPETMKAGAAYNLTKPGVPDAIVGKPVNLAIYFNVRDMWPGSQAIAEFTVQRGRGVHFFFQSRPMALPHCPDTYRVVVQYVPRSAGKDYIMGRISIAGVSAESVTTLPIYKAGHAPQARAASNGGAAPTKGEQTTTLTTVHESGSPFSLAVSALPPGSQVKTNAAADNAAAARSTVPHLSTRSWSDEGRLGGYLVDSTQANSGHPVYTAYLVSQFGAASQAYGSFKDQLGAYRHLSSTYPSRYVLSTPASKVGEHEAFAYSLTTVSGRPFYTGELYFTRGKVFVQVVQSYFVSDADPWGRHATPYLYAAASKLDSASRSAQ